ncbi:hypothetical protein JD965_13520 [Bacillus siamensis]|uniref:hypothetical protein n=1 Tax=Bacillus subtilis group TaxID=653685 RepID=UPI00073A6D7C|nr:MULTISPECIES: hypothetical protein [Bacillus subtilis group]ALV02208.1 hypothetical protein AVM03_07310 [Bacillus amyloliquefaciens]MCY8915635.1 hypothetical protein [Bacillus atrophaeus]MCY8924325.1 hypothetical protein [Bacillus atrophaeus]QQD80932.1 hypothetical protein JD965_13520 [Bacillus siamensis]QZY40397.1 hypothetical protein K4A81_14365 [Bacillus velezensis]
MRKLNLCDGKYTIVNELDNQGGFYALRYGQKWCSLNGDKLSLAMFHEIETLTEKNNDLYKALREIENGINKSTEDLTEIAIKILDEYYPHRSCPNCHDDCMGWISDGVSCGR